MTSVLNKPMIVSASALSYESPTVRVGMRVPILYLRTTRGRAGDWEFDAAWDTARRCGERRI